MSIIINTRKVYDNGVLCETKGEEVRAIKERLIKVADEITENYKGPDSHNFIVSFKTHINKLLDVEEFLNENASILKTNALEHGGEDNTFIAKVERSDISES